MEEVFCYNYDINYNLDDLMLQSIARQAAGSSRFLAALTETAFPLARTVAEDESFLQRFTEAAIVCNQMALEDQGEIRIHFHPQKRAFTFLLTLKAIDVPNRRFRDFAPLKNLSALKLLGVGDRILVHMVCPLFDFPNEFSFINFDEDFKISPDE